METHVSAKLLYRRGRGKSHVVDESTCSLIVVTIIVEFVRTRRSDGRLSSGLGHAMAGLAWYVKSTKSNNHSIVKWLAA